MNLESLQTQINERFQQLIDLLESQEPNEMEILKLGNAVLQLINEYLQLKPNDMYPRFLRLRTQAFLETNAQTILEEAEYIVKGAADDEDVNTAYNWISWLYEEKLAMPEKALEILQEQVMSLYGMFKDKIYRRDEIIGYALNTMGYIYQNMGKAEEALNTWVKSFEAYPYIHNRNGEAGLKLLEAERFVDAEKLLSMYYRWAYTWGDDFNLSIHKVLKEKIKQHKIEDFPNLIGLYYSIIRNNFDSFNIKSDDDFYKKYLTEILPLAQKYKNNSWLWSVVGNTFYFSKDYKKAIQAYIEVFNGDDSNRESYIDRIWKSCEGTKYDFFSLPFRFEGDSNMMYNILTELNTLYDDTEDIRLLEIAYQYGKVAYQQYTDYLFHGKGSISNNLPHPFAMFCNNYGIILENLAATKQGKEQKAMMQLAANVHWQGYQMSPFQENIQNAIDPAFYGELYEDCIKYADIFINEYADEADEDDVILKQRSRKIAQLKIESLQNENIKETIEIPKIFSDCSFHDEASWQAQLANYKKLFEIISPDFNNIEYTEEKKNQLVFEWSGYTITLMTEREQTDQTADCIIVKHSDGAFAFQYIRVEKSKGFFSFKKEPFEQFKIDIISNSNKDYTYQFGVETTLLNQLNTIWKEILSRAEIGQYYLQKFNAEITKEKILFYLDLPVIKEEYNEFWNSKKCGYWVADRNLFYRLHGAQHKKEVYPGILAIGISNKALAHLVRKRIYYFVINDLKKPSGIYLAYRSTDEKCKNGRYFNTTLYVSSFDWEMYREAIEEFQNYTPLILFENENYVADINES